MDKIALDRKSTITPADTHGRDCAFTAGIGIPATMSTRSGSLPEVMKIAVEAMMKPIARIPAKSRRDKRARDAVNKYQVLRSLGAMNAKLALIALSIIQV
jgi:hypothetical protein